MAGELESLPYTTGRRSDLQVSRFDLFKLAAALLLTGRLL